MTIFRLIKGGYQLCINVKIQLLLQSEGRSAAAHEKLAEKLPKIKLTDPDAPFITPMEKVSGEKPATTIYVSTAETWESIILRP